MTRVRRLFPWPCVGMFLRGLVRDASPGEEKTLSTVSSNEQESQSPKDQNGVAFHQALARRVSNSERKP